MARRPGPFRFRVIVTDTRGREFPLYVDASDVAEAIERGRRSFDDNLFLRQAQRVRLDRDFEIELSPYWIRRGGGYTFTGVPR